MQLAIVTYRRAPTTTRTPPRRSGHLLGQTISRGYGDIGYNFLIDEQPHL